MHHRAARHSGTGKTASRERAGARAAMAIGRPRVKAKLREDRQSAARPNETWAMDFIVHDQLATGRKLRVLTIIDTFSRFSPAIEPRFNFRGP